MSMTGCEGMGAYDLLEKQDWKASARRHSCQDQPVNNLSGSSSDVKNMVYLTHLLPTYLLHFTYGISLGVVISFLALYPLLFTSPHWRVPKHLGASAQWAEEQLDHTWSGLWGPRRLSWLRLNCSHIICCRTNAGICSYVLQVYQVYIYTIPDHVCTFLQTHKTEGYTHPLPSCLAIMKRLLLSSFWTSFYPQSFFFISIIINKSLIVLMSTKEQVKIIQVFQPRFEPVFQSFQHFLSKAYP